MTEAQNGRDSVTIQVTTAQRPQFQHVLTVFVFNPAGDLVHRAEVRDGKVELPLRAQGPIREQVLIAPVDPKLPNEGLTAKQLLRLGAYQPVLQRGGRLIDHIDVPGTIIDIWPFCFCWVRGKVVRASDNRAVCGARVHVCEVDRVSRWILNLPDAQVLRLRDDFLDVLRNPTIPNPRPRPDPTPEPFVNRAVRSALRFADDRVSQVALNPQPLPPGLPDGFAARALPMRSHIDLAPELQARLHSNSALVVRTALAEQWKLLPPFFCFWPHWWWLFDCDEVAVTETDSNGRFETLILYPCGGDRPDLYFWVEYDFGAGYETVHRSRIACNTHWNYVCGTEVTIRVTDPRVPGCEEEPDLPGCQVVVLSIGRGIAVRQLQSAGVEGLSTAGQPFGGTLEPRVDFSRTELIEARGIPYYRWSYRRLSGPDGVTAAAPAGSVPVNVWFPMNRDVYRHYKVGTGFPSDLMGPMPTAGAGAAPAANLFRIHPALPPAGSEWVVLNENIDLATAYFDTDALTGAPPAASPLDEDLAAGRYELKLELFDAAGALVDWTAQGVDLRITDQDAPFGTGTVTTSPAPAYNRILAGANTMGFRMVVRVDNNRCIAEILPVGGTVAPDPVCGFHNYVSSSDTAALSFVARHPNNFATYGFSTSRATSPAISYASTSGIVGDAGSNDFNAVGGSTYRKNAVISFLLGSCSNAAFSETLGVHAMATNGYATLSHYNAYDAAAFALAMPCPSCEGENAAPDAPGQRR